MELKQSSNLKRSFNLKQSWKITAYRKGFTLISVLAPLLIPLSWLYAFIVQFRRKCYKWGILKRQKINVPVISVGNLSVGGVGKTPFTMYLAKQLERMGKQPAIIMRGYGRKSKNIYVLTPENYLPKKIHFYGDEAALISFKTQIPVGIGSKRADVAIKLLKSIPCDCIILDDGFQHLPIQRDLDIILFDGSNPFGNRYTLPYGPLREPINTIKQANLFVFNSKPHDDVIHRSPATINFTGQLNWLDIQPLLEWYNRSGEHLIPIHEFSKKPVTLLSGIGSPERLEAQAISNGLNIVQHIAMPDHHWFTAEDLTLHFNRSAPHHILLTEKDAIRLVPVLHEIEPWWKSLYVIRAEWQMEDETRFEQWLQSDIIPLF